MIFVEMKWINHNEIEDWPNDLYIVLLNDRSNPSIIPIIIVIIIIVLKLFGKMSVCSGLIIHRSIVPKKIEVGIIRIMGILEKLLV